MTRQDYINHLDALRRGVLKLTEFDAKKGAKSKGKKKGGAK